MRVEQSQVEIQEPPLQEMKKKRSCLRRSCVTGLGCIFLFILVSLGILWFTVVPRPKELKQTPDSFPTAIPLYDRDSISRITFISGKEKSRTIQIAAFIPRLILSPIIATLDKTVPLSEDGNNAGLDVSSWRNILSLLDESALDGRDIIKVEWKDVNAQPEFMNHYFETGLKGSGFTVSKPREDVPFSFDFTNRTIDGTFFIQDDGATIGTDYFSLTVNVPH
ncbi:MAG TPA: hypothetical protein DCY48_01665 [Candidatus Magasanikbacteria bacterium]|nr:MAG: hypothetical protein A3I74_00575 [Candidatus Magasanikbacteria bacterium RIFCSPLOWO2_02_FULL_47_16]OGH80054.1 MAG: hypothetical protein A3C10_02650 [Candidatus Magasanikbacteria bacterium RIFCSPHIGHO2_02_FULL_48_18]OGH82814.1 MAG: hypothetical protein A3G08_00010 [Candidatus Magasanikbacteria bacterium RIFCSPLOWO2_12_FULL_47_9b]HAZ28464.1 hypothetical protein [Candidatus Magasanikbacteria bacterium]